MAVFNAQTVGSGGGSEWQYTFYAATSSDSTNATAISFGVSEQPKCWALVLASISLYYQVPTTSSSNYYTICAYYDGSSVVSGELRGGTQVNYIRNITAPTGSYSNGTFTVTAGTSRYFPMRSSSYYYTWYLFYTV